MEDLCQEEEKERVPADRLAQENLESQPNQLEYR